MPDEPGEVQSWLRAPDASVVRGPALRLRSVQAHLPDDRLGVLQVRVAQRDRRGLTDVVGLADALLLLAGRGADESPAVDDQLAALVDDRRGALVTQDELLAVAQQVQLLDQPLDV